MSLLKWHNIKKDQTNENNTSKLDIGNNDNKKYIVKAIYNNKVYAKKLKSRHLSKLYYLIF